MNLSHKIRLNPTRDQEQYFRKACGTSRKAYNWALEQWKLQYKAEGKPSVFGLDKLLNSIKKEEFPWMYESPSCVPQHAITDLGKAFKNFFHKTTKYPVFKKKGKRDSFYLTNQVFKIKKNQIKVPKLGWVKMYEPLRFEGKIMSAVVSRTADRWFVAITVDLENLPTVCESQETVGIDLGINKLAVLSNGEVFEPPRALYRYERKLKKLHRRLAKKHKKTRNRAKARMKLSKLYYRIKCIRDDFAHKMTTYIVKNFGLIVIEDLHVKGMVKNHCLAKAIMDKAWSEIRRQLEYKALLCGSGLKVVSRWFPSSKLCSSCGWKNDKLTLKDRMFVCEQCGLKIDRDLNAALNLKLSGTGCLPETEDPLDLKIKPVEIMSDSLRRATVCEAGRLIQPTDCKVSLAIFD